MRTRTFVLIWACMVGPGCSSRHTDSSTTEKRSARAADAFLGDGRGDRISGRRFATRSPVIAQGGVAATAHPLASQVALDVLKLGGSAVDAAIAANAALGLMEPVGCGIGGDLFALVWDPKKETLVGLNASGRSPRGQTLEALRARLGDDPKHLPKYGSTTVTVPGAVDGWFELHERFGRLPMSSVLAPAIAYAESGFPVSQLVALYWKKNFERFEEERKLIEDLENAKRTFLVAGHPPDEGTLFKNPDLAQTYRILAEEGRDAFYRGRLADTMAAFMGRIGGALERRDLEAHRSDWVTPMHVQYRGYDVYELPPNTQGLAALQMLAILDDYDLASLGWGSAQALHLMVEAKRLAFADRARYYADPDFSKIPLEVLISKDYIAGRRAEIDVSRARSEVGPGALPLEDGDTTYLTVADADGMMVSLIQSNYRGMGSGLVPDGLGFMLQNRGELFSLEEGHPNAYAPGKRPFHTIIPAFVLKDGRPFLSFGVMGGAMQPQGHVQILSNIIDFGMNVQEAGDAARWRHDGSAEPTGHGPDGTGTIYLERGFSSQLESSLSELGHRVMAGGGGFGGYQAILVDPETGFYHAASEMRKDGAAAGY